MYCAGITKAQLIDWGITKVEYNNDTGEWLVYRVWRKNSNKKPIEKVIKVTNATRHHKYRGDKSYPKITFSVHNHNYNFTLSKLVYVWFKGDIPDGYVVDHIDNDSFNNDPNNLQLLTIGENLAKRFTDNPNAWTNQWGKQKGYGVQ